MFKAFGLGVVLASAFVAPLAAQVAVRPVPTVVEGADPRGVEDSAEAFQRAVGPNRVVVVPPGRYRLSKAIVLCDHLVIEAPRGPVTLFVDPRNIAAGGALLMTGVKIEDVTVRGVTFDGNLGAMAKPVSWKTRLTFINGGARVVFASDTWRDSGGSALVFSGAAGPVVASGVRDSTFEGLGFAWKPPADGALGETAPVIVFANGSAGANHDNFVISNVISNVGSDAISIQQQTRFLGDRNRLDLGQAGWKPLTKANAVTFGVGGFYVFQKKGEASNNEVTLSQNEVRGATGNCFDLVETSHLHMTDNVATGCGGAGISLGTGISSFEVTRNVLTHDFQSARFPFPNITHRGALSFSCGHEPCTGTIEDGQIRDNVFKEGAAATQPIDVWRASGVSLRNVAIDVVVVEEPRPLGIPH